MVGTWRAAAIASLTLAVVVVIRAGYRAGGDTELYVAGADALRGDGSYGAVPYPPGLPALLVPFRAFDLPVGLVATASSLAVVALVWALAVRLSGPPAGVIAGLVLVMSPIFAEYGALVMSDAPATALMLGGLIAATYGRWRLCGLLIAASAWVRVSHAFFAVAMPRVRPFVVMLAGLAPLAIFNVGVYGSLSGYASGAAEFSPDYLTGTVWFEVVGDASRFSNLYLWPAILVGRFGLLVPLLPVFAAAELWQRRSVPAVRLAAGIILVNLVTHWFYFFQSPRFMLPSAAILVAYSAGFAGRVMNGILDRDGRASIEVEDASEAAAVGRGDIGVMH